MRVLWFTNTPLLPVTRKRNLPDILGEGWLNGLHAALKGSRNIDLGVASISEGQYEPFAEDGVTFYNIPIPRDSSPVAAVYRRWLHRDEPPNALPVMHTIINDFQPDLIHIHGSENFLGSIIPETSIPAILSIQGIVSAIEPFYYGGLSCAEKIATNLNINFLKGDGEFHSQLGLRISGRREREIFKNCRFFTGRTEFDRNFTLLLRPDARYFHCDRVLRSPFYSAEWDEQSLDRHVIYCTMNYAPYKGLDCLLRACHILKQNGFPGVQLRIGGQIQHTNLWGTIERKVKEYGLMNDAVFLGAISPQNIVSELEKASVFVLPSYIDNSSNSLAEAMMAGVPCIASYGGGTPSLMEHGVDGLLFSPGDAYSLAGLIARLFREPALAKALSANARKTAQQRHDPQKIATDMERIYSAVIHAPYEKEWANREPIEISISSGSQTVK